MSLPSHPQRPDWRLRIAVSDLLLFLIVNLAALRLAGLFFSGILGGASFGLEPPGDTLVLAIVLSLIFLQALVILVSLRSLILRPFGVTWADLGMAPCSRIWVRRAVYLALGLLPLAAAINAGLSRFLDLPFENPQIFALAPTGFSWPALAGMTVMGGILAPLAEEIAFRGLFFRWLRPRMGFGSAATLSAVCFALLHGVAILTPALVAVGLALAWITERSGSVWPAIVTHGVFNSVMILTLYAALAGAGH